MTTAPSSRLSGWLAAAGAALGSRLEAELLAGHGLGRERAWLYAHRDERLAADQEQRLEALLARRRAGEPIAYILGSREFYGRDFRVSPAVMIPRPETELLIELALGLDLPDGARVADLGTGSGCIALTLAAERPAWRVAATDTCAAALEITAANRDKLGLAGRVELARGDLFAPLAGRRFDLVVSNPPYIAGGDPHLEQGDLRFEPAGALAAPDDGLTTPRDGLSIIRRIIDCSPDHLNPNGWLLLEHGHDQGPRVRALLQQAGFEAVRSHRDLAGIERASGGRT